MSRRELKGLGVTVSPSRPSTALGLVSHVEAGVNLDNPTPAKKRVRHSARRSCERVRDNDLRLEEHSEGTIGREDWTRDWQADEVERVRLGGCRAGLGQDYFSSRGRQDGRSDNRGIAGQVGLSGRRSRVGSPEGRHGDRSRSHGQRNFHDVSFHDVQLPINVQGGPSMEQFNAVLLQVQQLQASNRDDARQVRSPSLMRFDSPREQSPVNFRMPNTRDQSAYPPHAVTDQVSKKPPPPIELSFPAVSLASDKLLRHRSSYVVLQDLLADSFVPDSTRRKAGSDSGINVPTISDLTGWLNAFAVFALYRGYYFPELSLAYTAYVTIIRGLASRKPDPRIWLEYDQRFRQKMALFDSNYTAWFHKDRDVVRVVKTNLTSLSGTHYSRFEDWKVNAVCHICSAKGHIAPQCPRREGAFRPPFNSRSNKFENSNSYFGNRSKPSLSLACSRFNEIAGCSEPCVEGKPHNCSVCLKSGHSRLNHAYV